MDSHTNEAGEESSCRANEDGSFISDCPSNAQIDSKRKDHLHTGFDTVAWKKITENDCRVYFKVGKNSSSSSPDTPDTSENLKLANKMGECSLKAATACRLVANITFDAIDVGEKLLENSLRKADEVNSQYASCYSSVTEKYRTAVDVAFEKAREAEGAARVANIAGGNALRIAKRLSELIDVESEDTKEVNFQATWATTIAQRTKTHTFKTACTAFEAMKTFWKELCDIRNMELDFNRNVDGHSRRKVKFINIVLILLLALGCLIVVLKNFWKIFRDSDTLISVGVSLVIGSIIAGVAINVYYSNVESVAQMEKIRKAMTSIEKSLHYLEKSFKKNKFSELSDDEEKSNWGILS